jgi:hypothetical protein
VLRSFVVGVGPLLNVMFAISRRLSGANKLHATLMLYTLAELYKCGGLCNSYMQ